MSGDIRVAIIGTGNWGRNHVRVFASTPSCRVSHLVDVSDENLAGARRLAPRATALNDYRRLLDHEACDAAVIATPAETHYAIARDLLRAGKHVLVEKPLALNAPEAWELMTAGKADGTKLMVGHLLHYHPAVRFLRDYIAGGELGQIRCIYSSRLNPVAPQAHEDALWSFAPHDIATSIHLLGDSPATVQALGCLCQPSPARKEGIRNRPPDTRHPTPDTRHPSSPSLGYDVVFFNLRFPEGTIEHGHGSWLGTQKVRRLTVVGTRRTAVFDDLNAARRVQIYDRQSVPEPPARNRRQPSFDIRRPTPRVSPFVPKFDPVEPLRVECEHFLTCIRDDRQPLTDGAIGWTVVRILNALERSLEQNGATVAVQE